MRKLMFLMLTFVSGYSYSMSPGEFCDREIIGRSSFRACMGIIQSGRFQNHAVNYCADEMSFDDDKLSCMRSIKSRYFDEGALRACGELSFRSEKLECLDLIADKEYSDRMANICANEFPSRNIKNCLSVNGRHRYIQNSRSRSERIREFEKGDGDYTRVEREVEHRGNKTIITETVYDHEEYVACYERPKTRLVEYTDKKKAKRGRKKVIGGLIAAIGGQVIGGDVGDVISVAGAGVAIYGAIQIEDSKEIIYQDNGYDCRSYYTVDKTTYTKVINNRRCVTQRYYTNRWGSTHEYFETTCGNSRYMSFERNSDIWY